MSNLNKFLQECRDIEAKATKKNWRVDVGNNWKRLVYRPMDEWGIHEQAETLIGRWDSLNGIQEFNNQDAEFIAFSRNNFMKLVECVEVLSGVTEKLSGRAYVNINPNQASYDAYEALSRVEEILGSNPEAV